MSHFHVRTYIKNYLKYSPLIRCFYTTIAQRNISEGFQPIIGLELHAQLATKTKLFSESCSTDNSSVESNCHVSIFDSAIPGTLPRLNSSCIDKALLTAVLLNCQVSPLCRFDRKHYFYPDLPLGYQITQKSNPIAKNGYFTICVQSSDENELFYQKSVGIEQIQLEMDSGKSIRHGALDLIDLNRAGIALIEIVTSPEFYNPVEVICFVEQIRMALAHNQICHGHFHEGNLRVDANVSISKNGEKGSKVELKNLSGIGHLFSSLTKEIDRQLKLIKLGELIEEETRAVDEQGKTFSARSKGSELDYRFMPEPNIPPMKIDSKMIKNAQNQVLLDFPYLNYIINYGFPPNFTMEILNCKRMEKLIQIYLECGPPVPFNHFKKWLDELRFLCEKLTNNDNNKNNFPPTNIKLIYCFAQVVHLSNKAMLTNLVGIDLMREFAEDEETENEHFNKNIVKELIEARNLWRITNLEEIDELVNKVMADQKITFLVKLDEEKSKIRSRAMAKFRREVIINSNKRIAPEDVEESYWRISKRNKISLNKL